jgi:hypothetical protein
MKSEEVEKKNEECKKCLTAEEMIAQRKAKIGTFKRVWFWLTCWRPLTKYEMAKKEEIWLRVGLAVLNNHRAIESIIKNLNGLALELQSKGVIDTSQKTETKKEEKNRDVMFN